MRWLKPDAFDRALMDTPPYNAQIADHLLVLEMLFRRAQEQNL